MRIHPQCHYISVFGSDSEQQIKPIYLAYFGANEYRSMVLAVQQHIPEVTPMFCWKTEYISTDSFVELKDCLLDSNLRTKINYLPYSCCGEIAVLKY